MAVNEKYGGIDGHTGRQEVVDDFIESMTIERNKQKINKMLNLHPLLVFQQSQPQSLS
jgi:hypothetical protein